MTINSRLEKLEAAYHPNGQGADRDFAFFVALVDRQNARECFACVSAPESVFDRFRIRHYPLTNYDAATLNDLQRAGVEVVVIFNPDRCGLDLWQWDNAIGAHVIAGFDLATVRPEHLHLWRDCEPGQFIRASLERMN